MPKQVIKELAMIASANISRNDMCDFKSISCVAVSEAAKENGHLKSFEHLRPTVNWQFFEVPSIQVVGACHTPNGTLRAARCECPQWHRSRSTSCDQLSKFSSIEAHYLYAHWADWLASCVGRNFVWSHNLITDSRDSFSNYKSMF